MTQQRSQTNPPDLSVNEMKDLQRTDDMHLPPQVWAYNISACVRRRRTRRRQQENGKMKGSTERGGGGGKIGDQG